MIRMSLRHAWPVAVVALAAPVGGAEDLPALEARGTIRVLVPGDEIPEMFAFQIGSSPGFEREILERFASSHRLHLEAISVSDFERILPSLLEGRGDVVTGVNDTPARREIVDFTTEVLPSRHVVVTRRPHLAVTSAYQLRAERVGVQRGTTWAEAAAKVGADAREFADQGEILRKMRSGEITATVMSAVDFILAQRQDRALEAGAILGAPGSAAWAVRKEDGRLKAALDELLAATRASGDWLRLVVKYYGRDAPKVFGIEGP
jgi:ABC-type amino acid transport substrate-binding protein